ncbi:MAG: OmpA family protein [Inquilinus sp.]|nr:OmpA family protein [Inquilinus sp.]
MMMNKTMWSTTVSVGALLLAGCAGPTIDEFKTAEATGTPFTRALANEYRQTVAYEADEMYDWRDAAYFARKGLRTANGEAVEPESLENWKLPADSVDELSSARGRLAKVLSEGAREAEPEAAALAQAKFDCWVEQQEENHQPSHIAACRDQFMTAIAAVEDKTMMPMAAAEQVDFLVFFDHDSAALTSAGQSTLASLIDAAKGKAGAPTITVTGHADKSGAAAYNAALSMRRAEVIKSALQNAGLTDASIVVEAAGENDPLVVTADGVREPSNRCAAIKVQ